MADEAETRDAAQASEEVPVNPYRGIDKEEIDVIVGLIVLYLTPQPDLQKITDSFQADLKKARDKAPIAHLQAQYDVFKAMVALDDDVRRVNAFMILAALFDDQQREEVVVKAMVILGDDGRRELTFWDGIVRKARHGG